MGRSRDCREASERALRVAPHMFQVCKVPACQEGWWCDRTPCVCACHLVCLAQAHLQMASVLYKEDRLREAVAYYQSAISLNPTDQQSLLSLANTYGDIYR